MARQSAAQKRAEEEAAAEAASKEQEQKQAAEATAREQADAEADAEQEKAAAEAQELADHVQRDAQEPDGDADGDAATDEVDARAEAEKAAQVENTDVTDANGAPEAPNATGAVATANGVLPPEPGTETRVGIDGVADPALIHKVPEASVGAFPVADEHQPESADERPNDPNAHGAVHAANGEQPVEPGTETRVGIDGVADPKIIRKEPAVPGAPLEAPAAPAAIRTSNVEQSITVSGALGAAMVGKGDRLLDEETGEAPDPDAMFSNELGSVYVSQVRLIEEVAVGNGSYTTRLILPKGQSVSAVTAQQFQAAVRDQG